MGSMDDFEKDSNPVTDETQKKFEEACDSGSQFFDEEEFVNEYIMPLWKRIHTLCAERAIPVVFSLCYANSEETAKCSSGMVIPGKRSPENMHQLANVLQGNDNFLMFTKDELYDAVRSLKSILRLGQAFGR